MCVGVYDLPSWYDTDKCWAETFEQGLGAFMHIDISVRVAACQSP